MYVTRTPTLGCMEKKMKKLKVLIVLSLLSIVNLYGRDYQKEATELLQNGNFDQCITLLKEWEKVEPKNLEINIYYFNYYGVIQ